MAFVIIPMAPLLAIYGNASLPATTDQSDPLLTITPPPWPFIMGSTSLHMRQTAVTLIANVLSHILSEVVSAVPAVTMPALLNRMSTRPNSARVRSTTREQPAAWE